jgi:hypothetical protein
MDAKRALFKSTEEALSSLGKPAMEAITWQMNEKGVDMAVPENFDINRFATVLGELLGEGSETVLNMIYMNMCRQLKIDMQVDPDLPVLERINRILKTEKMN